MAHTVAIDAHINRALDYLYKQLGEACAFAGLGEGIGKLPEETKFPVPETFPSFYWGRSINPDDLPSPREIIGRNFAAYCCKFAVLHMITATEVYLADLLVSCQAIKAFHEAPDRTIKKERFEALVLKARKKVRNSSFENLVKTSLANLEIPASLVQSRIDNLRSIYKLRVCLAHRGGVVGIEDAPSGVLNCEWLKVTFEVDGVPIAKLPATIPAGGMLSAPIRADAKTWRVGETIQFSFSDCQGIATTLAFGCTHIRDEVLKRAGELLSSS